MCCSSSADDLVSGLNWFNATLKGRSNAPIAFDQGLLRGNAEARLVASLQRKNTGSVELG